MSFLISLAVLIGCTAAAGAVGWFLAGAGVPSGEPHIFAPVTAIMFALPGAGIAIAAVGLNYAWGGWW